ncbi:hypothetical protein BGZ82_009713 [Podila clonocystis]|nr:hypothetical protein BGZ82_009713 [Podila clonocystis]
MTAAGVALLVGLLSVQVVADALPNGLGPCMGNDCPASYPPPNHGPLAGRDNSINVFVGGDLFVRQAAAVAEGKVVVLGNFDLNKAAGTSQVYNIGIVRDGSRVPPDDGTDFLTAGKDIKIAAGQRLLAEEGSVSGIVKYGGTLTGTVVSKVVRDPGASTSYSALKAELTATSQCYAYVDGKPRAATGTVRIASTDTVFTGDGTSAIQVFNVDFDLKRANGDTLDLKFDRIPSGATVLVNVYGESREINTHAGILPDVLRDRLMWNFPDATSVSLGGSGHLSGSVLIGQASSMAIVTLSSMNGRFFTAGSLTHTSATHGDQQIHAYPFDGDLPTCP